MFGIESGDDGAKSSGLEGAVLNSIDLHWPATRASANSSKTSNLYVNQNLHTAQYYQTIRSL